MLFFVFFFAFFGFLLFSVTVMIVSGIAVFRVEGAGMEVTAGVVAEVVTDWWVGSLRFGVVVVLGLGEVVTEWSVGSVGFGVVTELGLAGLEAM